jgi:hypothetical protein
MTGIVIPPALIYSLGEQQIQKLLEKAARGTSAGPRGPVGGALDDDGERPPLEH